MLLNPTIHILQLLFHINFLIIVTTWELVDPPFVLPRAVEAPLWPDAVDALLCPDTVDAPLCEIVFPEACDCCDDPDCVVLSVAPETVDPVTLPKHFT